MQFAPTEPEQFEPFVGGFDGQAMEDAPPVACVPPIPELPPFEVEPPPTDRFPPEPTVTVGSEPEQAERHADTSNSTIAKHRNWVNFRTGTSVNCECIRHNLLADTYCSTSSGPSCSFVGCRLQCKYRGRRNPRARCRRHCRRTARQSCHLHEPGRFALDCRYAAPVPRRKLRCRYMESLTRTNGPGRWPRSRP